MTDNGMKSLVSGVRGVTPNGEPVGLGGLAGESAEPDQALLVLTLAQKTAEDHVADARRKADRVRADARSAAEQVLRDARTQGEKLLQEAEKALADARANAAQLGREGKAQLEKARRNAEELLAEARGRADEITKNAQAGAEELKQQAQLRYDDVVGSLAAKRAGLQRQIEALDQFDREYRGRLTSFLQAQLRTLWVEEPHVTVDDLELETATAPSVRPPVAREPS